MSRNQMLNVVNVDEVLEEAVKAPKGWVNFCKALIPSP